MNAEYFRTLISYNSWATRRVIEAAATANEADYFADRAGLSFGNLHGAIVHVLNAEDIWLGRWRAALPAALFAASPEPSVRPTVESLPDRTSVARMADEISAAMTGFVGALADTDLDAPVRYIGPGEVEYTDPLCLQLAHVINHGTQFRGEAAVRLTELGLTPGSLDLTVLLRGLA